MSEIEEPITRTDTALAKVRAKIRQNFPKERKALIWRKVSENTIRSECGRFRIERRGEGAAERFTAFLHPATVIGHRMGTAAMAKEVCEQHASPLPLEPLEKPVQPTLSGPATLPLVEREPGSDDDLGEQEAV